MTAAAYARADADSATIAELTELLGDRLTTTMAVREHHGHGEDYRLLPVADGIVAGARGGASRRRHTGRSDAASPVHRGAGKAGNPHQRLGVARLTRLPGDPQATQVNQDQ